MGLLRTMILGTLLTPIPDIPKRIEMAGTMTDKILAKMREVVKGAELTDKEINKALGYQPRPAPQAGSMEIGSAIFVAKAQVQAIQKAMED